MDDATTVRTGCQKDLNDKGERNWYDEVIDRLDSEYGEDWRHPSRTYMVPCVFPNRKREADKGELAENKFFLLLQEFGEKTAEGMFVIHSHNFKELISVWKKESQEMKEKWLIGEHDFVIIHHKLGIIFFEVKASETTAAYAKADNQLRKGKESFQVFLKDNVRGIKKSEIGQEVFSTYPGFVVMPNCPRPGNPIVNPCNGVFKEDCENVEAFSKWWREKIQRHTKFDQRFFEHSVMRFVGLAHNIPLNYSKVIDGNHAILEMYTEKQLSVILNSVPKQWITGPAGSGKTWLLMKKVLMLVENAVKQGIKENILVTCYNKPLSVMFDKTFKDELKISENENLQGVVTVKTFKSLLFDITGSTSGDTDKENEEHVAQALGMVREETGPSLQRYDHIFVDECQDLYGEWPTLMKMLQKDDKFLERKHIWFLCDANQTLRLSKVSVNQYLGSIENSFWLPKVFRNTGKVFELSKKYFDSIIPNSGPIELGHNIPGLDIKWDASLTSQDVKVECGASFIKKHIEDLRSEKVKDKDICILTQNVPIRNEVSSELRKEGIESQNAEQMFVNDDNKVVVESTWRFKGLESKVVILYNPPVSPKDGIWTRQKYREILYTSVSRCFCYLIVISTEFGCKELSCPRVTPSAKGKGTKINTK